MLAVFIQRKTSVMKQATGTDLTALIKGEKIARQKEEIDVKTANIVPMTNEIKIPIRTRSMESERLFQKSDVVTRSHRASAVWIGDGSKSLSPSASAHTNQSAIQNAQTAVVRAIAIHGDRL